MAIDDDDDYQGTRKRVSLLEVDDDDGSLRLVARRAEEATHRAAAEEAGRRAEAERDAQAAEESMQASRNRRIEMDREAEAQERRNAASRERVALKKAKAAAAHSRKSAKDKANNELHKLNYNHYWKTKADGMEAMRHACRDAGFTVTGEIWNESGDLESGRATSMLDLGGDEYGLTITWYQMPSGRWELAPTSGGRASRTST